MSCSVDLRHSSDLALLWLQCRLAAAALIPPLAWELPYTTGMVINRQKKGFFENLLTTVPGTVGNR